MLRQHRRRRAAAGRRPPRGAIRRVAAVVRPWSHRSGGSRRRRTDAFPRRSGGWLGRSTGAFPRWPDAFSWRGGRPARRFREGLSDEDGSTLLMYPFAVLIVLAIGAIAIDGAVLFQAHRQAVDVAAGLASDMAAVIDEEAFATSGTVRIDPVRARDQLAYANDVVLADHPNQLVCTATVEDDAVAVTCSGTGEPVLLTMSGHAPGLSFRATATASARERG